MRRAPLDWWRDLPCRVGEIFIESEERGKIRLCHRDDAARRDLTIYTKAEAALEIARYDDAGSYRPLKTAPNLRHGWVLVLPAVREAAAALDFFYPGRAAVYRAWKVDALSTTPLRETLGRQTGMYRVAAKIGDAQCDEVVADFCRSAGGCLRTILWKRDGLGASASPLLPPEKFDPDYDQTGRGEGTLPLLCQEACNLLVAQIRQAVRDEG